LAPLGQNANAWEPFNATFAPSESVVTVYINQEGTTYPSVVGGLTVLQLTGGLFLLVRPFADPSPTRPQAPFGAVNVPSPSCHPTRLSVPSCLLLRPSLARSAPSYTSCPFAARVYVSWEPARTQLDAAVRCWCAPLRHGWLVNQAAVWILK
jgi:hypothetical protein